MSGTGLFHFDIVHEATAVLCSAKGRFLGPNRTELVLAFPSHIQIFSLAQQRLVLERSVKVNGRIKLIRPVRAAQPTRCDMLFVTTEKYDYSLLSFDGPNDFTIHSSGCLKDVAGRPIEEQQLVNVDPRSTLVGVHILHGQYKVYPLDPKSHAALGAPVALRVHELDICAVSFLDCADTVVAFIHQNSQGDRVLATHTLNLSAQILSAGPFEIHDIDRSSYGLVPLRRPLQGVLLLSRHSICCTKDDKGPNLLLPCANLEIVCHAWIGSEYSRVLLADQKGILYLLVLAVGADNCVDDLKLETLGQITIPSTMEYLENGILHIGSKMADSQLLLLKTARESDGNFFVVLKEDQSLAPIVDLCAVDLNGTGASQVFTCSGFGRFSAIKTVTNGICEDQAAVVDLEGAVPVAVWAVGAFGAQSFHSHIVISFSLSTAVLRLLIDEVEDTVTSGFKLDERTLLSADCAPNCVLQVTPSSLRVVNISDGKCVCELSPQLAFSMAAYCDGHVAAVDGGTGISLFRVSSKTLSVVSQATMDDQVSCIACASPGNSSTPLCAVGLWNECSVCVLSVPNMLVTKKIKMNFVPRSICFTALGNSAYFMASLADGRVEYFSVAGLDFDAESRRSILMYRLPVTLYPEASHSGRVFAISEHSSVLHANKISTGGISSCSLNIRGVSSVSRLNTLSFPESLLIARPGEIVIATLSENQNRLHVSSTPIGVTARCIRHSRALQAFCVATVLDGASDEPFSDVRIFEQTTLRQTDVARLLPGELAHSLCAFKAPSGDEQFIVGTGFASPEETEATRGRIVSYSIASGKLGQTHSMETKGAVYSLEQGERFVVASVHTVVCLFKLDTDGFQLVAKCPGQILPLYLSVSGSTVAVGDLMRSVSMLEMSEDELKGATLSEAARDYCINWTTAVQNIDGSRALAADNFYNMYVCENVAIEAGDSSRMLATNGQIHIGDFVNRISRGSFSAGRQRDSFIFGTVGGAIGTVSGLSEAEYRMLSLIQERMKKRTGWLFDIDRFRGFETEVSKRDCDGFIQGDLLRLFSSLSEKTRELILHEADVLQSLAQADELVSGLGV